MIYEFNGYLETPQREAARCLIACEAKVPTTIVPEQVADSTRAHLQADAFPLGVTLHKTLTEDLPDPFGPGPHAADWDPPCQTRWIRLYSQL